jgi:hypothetical protein
MSLEAILRNIPPSLADAQIKVYLDVEEKVGLIHHDDLNFLVLFDERENGDDVV